ncbi:two-partner secretion domain-containing protein [aff. Roholtiella sp. LEGE 12411]|uniref:two-partner secretion domain-containing protein n=1 Tax=aff. Roholtiella sp. LEGE 12411 TaxID=1828822 RepID=UPI0018817C90|nr:filamentous hemagglutinin N-terminal domain-containing protein [aff. Roholtiella sp. LEGE 12411]MBE9036108.1 filamentous hemagglutinin N-terminal domain-containing protein [aff. Roholtiella sp. LEGE 12411]
MTQSAKGCSWQLSLLSYLATAGTLTFSIAFPFANSVFAQSAITADDSLGDERSQVIENYLGNPTEALTGGASRDNNLFHSFLEFNVKENRSAVFLSPSNIQNILVRVTGSNRSEILGRLGISGSNANLFLINPNGIIFGPNATLNVGGSFVASTASSVKFAGDNVFSATAPQTTSLLTVNVPIGLQFGRTGGDINLQGTLAVQSGKTLALVGGNITLDGGNVSLERNSLEAKDGQIALGGILEAGTVELNLDSNNQILSFPKDVVLADISFKNQARVDVSGEGGGYIQLQGKRITLTDASQAVANTLGNQNGRGISIQAEQLTLQDGSQVSTSVGSSALPGVTGSGGSLVVRATDSVKVIGTIPTGKINAGNPSALFADTYGQGAAGSLTIETGKLIVENGGNVSTAARQGSGRGGELEVTATDFVKLSGVSDLGFPNGLFTQTLDAGNAGSLTIKTPALIIQGGSVVTAGTGVKSQGNGGALTVRASDSVELSGTTPNSQETSGLFARSRGSGDAGSVSITTGRLIVRDQAQVTVAALGSGNAGNLDITAREIRLDRQGKLLANTTSGNGGNINLQLQNLLLLRNMSQISATAGTAGAGGGNGGNITIDSPNGFIVAVPNENSDISANAFTGSGGKVEITAYGVFGIEPRSREDLEKLLGTNDPTKLNPQKLPTNDITAISQANPTLNGVVNINTPDIDLNEGLINLPTQPVELKVAQVCKAGAGRNQNSFTVTGRGGVPSSPTEPLSADAVLADWITLDKVSATPHNTPVTQNYTKPNPETIVEATGWEINAKGEIVLTATVPNVTHHNSWQKSADCSALQASS